MARYLTKEPRYGLDGFEDVRIDRDDDVITILPDNPIDQVTTPQVTANQNNYPIPAGDTLVQLVDLNTDASRTFTGFSGARHGLIVLRNGGSFDVVIAHDNAGSTTENRTLCHTGANITLNPFESVAMLYNFDAERWITIGFT